MPDKESEDPEIRRFERELEHREKNIEAVNELLKEVPSLLSKLTTEVVLPLVNSLQPQQQQEMRSPLKSRQQPQKPRNRGKPEYNPFEGNSQEAPGPLNINNEGDNNS